jgi:hypothetical protein
LVVYLWAGSGRILYSEAAEESWLSHLRWCSIGSWKVELPWGRSMNEEYEAIICDNWRKEYIVKLN